MKNNNLNTGWGGVASWYEATVNNKFSSQKDIILPALLKFVLRENFVGKKVLDLGCGTGFFIKEFLNYKPESITGIDLDVELLKIAEQNIESFKIQNRGEMSRVKLFKQSAENLDILKSEKFDLIFAIESLVNMKDIKLVAKEISKVISDNGRFIAVVNHPAFRVPQSADWYYDENLKKQGRVVYKYKTAHTIKIDMNPGSKINKKFTYTFHRPFEEYVNTFAYNGLYLKVIREVCSPKKSGKGPRQAAEDVAREEIPMFLFLEFAKM